MTLMTLQTWGIYEFIPSTYLISKNTKQGYAGAFLAGVFLLLLYSAGHSFLVLAAGTSVGLVKRITSSGRYGLFSALMKFFMGSVILIIGFYMFYLGF